MIKTEQKGKIRWIILNRPEKRNALNSKLVGALKSEIADAYLDSNTRAVILKGEGKAFCSGADLAYIQQLQKNKYEENLADSNHLKELYQLIYSGDKPVIAAVNGHAIAGGAGLVSVCDFALSIPEAKFGFTEVRIGFIPALVSIFLVRKIGESKAREILLRGDLFQADRAMEIGMIHEIHPAEGLDKAAEELASMLAESNSGESMKTTKKLLSEASDIGLHKALDLAAQFNARSRESEDCKKGIAAFLNKESPKWD